MPNDDWIGQIHKDREAEKSGIALAAQNQAERKRIFESKAEAIWRQIAEELDRVVDVFNMGSVPPQVHKERSPLRFRASCGRSTSVQVFMDAGHECLRVERQEVSSAQLNAMSMGSFQIVACASGDLTVGGLSIEAFAREILEPFFRSISPDAPST